MGVVYVHSPLMPLSKMGIENVAARRLGVTLALRDAAELQERTDREASPVPAVDPTAATLIAAGATNQFPAVVLHRDGRLVGDAILAYKADCLYL